MTTILALNCVVFLLLAMIWTKKDWLNFLIKFLFTAAFASNAILLAETTGYIVKFSVKS